MNIFLTGFMGCGKSTIGSYMADREHYSFIDTDSYIEEKEQRTIADIFEKDKEEAFRDMETETLRQLIASNTCETLIAVGGGLPVREINRILMHQLGAVVYLRASVSTLMEHLKGDNTRPLLQGGELHARIIALMEARESIYENNADVIIDTDNKTVEQIYKELKEELVRYENTCN